MKKIGFTMSLVFFLIFSANSAFADLNDGLVAYYPFNGNANDESGNGYNGTLKPSLENGPTLCEDKIGNPNSAYCFDGVDDYIKVLTDGFKNQPFSVVAWIKTNSKGNGTIVHYRNINAYYGWGLWPGLHDEQTCLIFGLGSFNTGGTVEAISCNDIYDDVWHFTAGTDDGETLRLYIDGNLVSSSDSATAVWDAIMYLYVGAHDPESSHPDDYWFTGAIEDIRIYNRALSEDEIQELYNQPVANAGPDKIICNQICDKVVLDGRKSDDPNGEIVSYEWELDHEQDSCDKSTSGEIPTVTGLCPGTYDVTLTVTDNDGLTGTDKMKLAVLETCDPCSIMQGDFDSDGDVDGVDLRIFSGHFGTFPLTP